MRAALYSLTLLCVACSRATEPATVLSVQASPAAQVSIDGAPAGTTPVEVDVTAGSHVVTLQAESFRTTRKTIEVDEGVRPVMDVTLVPEDPHDPVALRRLGDGLGIAFVDLEAVVRMRGGRDTDWIVPALPRGKVRLGDLDRYRIDVGTGFSGTGTIGFRRGSRVLASEPLPAGEAVIDRPLPAEVLEYVRERGGTITWGFFPERGRPVTGRFEVVRRDSGLDRRLASLKKRIADQPETVQRQMRAQLLLNKDYPLAAYREAERVVAAGPGAGQAIAIMQAALRKMDLAEGPLWDEVQDGAATLPARVRARMDAAKGR